MKVKDMAKVLSKGATTILQGGFKRITCVPCNNLHIQYIILLDEPHGLVLPQFNHATAKMIDMNCYSNLPNKG